MQFVSKISVDEITMSFWEFKSKRDLLCSGWTLDILVSLEGNAEQAKSISDCP